MSSHETLIQDEDFSALSLPDKLSHKVWKARQQGYEELYGKWKYIESPSDPEFRKYADHVKSICSDANAAALDTGYNAILLFINHSELAIKQRKELLSIIIEKGLVATKSTTKAKALEALLSFVFIDQSDPVMEELIVFFDSKQPKLIVAAIAAIYEIIKAFGVPPVQCKHLFKELPKIFAHSDKFVRIEAQKLAIEIYRWIGQALLPFLETLKPIQLKELHDAFNQLSKEKPEPERYLRSHIPKALPASTDATAEESQAESTDGGAHSSSPTLEPADPFEFIEPVQIASKIPGNFDELVSSANWKERKEALDALLPILKVTRIADGKYGDLVSQLSKKISDTNINIVISAANCIEALARGLRAGFSPYQPQVISGLLDRLKEKKNTVIDALRSCLDAILDYSQLADFKEHIVTALSHKNPQIKSETLLWLARALKRAKVAPLKSDVQPLCEPLLKCFEDGANDVREAAFEVFACFLRLIGEKGLGATIEKIEKLKMAKIQDYADKMQLALQGSTAGPQMNKTAASQPVKPGLQVKSLAPAAMPSKPLASTASGPSLPTRKPVSGVAHHAKPAAPTTVAPPTPKPMDVSPTLTWGDEQAEDHIFGQLPPNLALELVDTNWKVRLAAMESVLGLLDSTLQGAHTEAITRSLLRKPGFKDSNIQVLAKLIETLSKVLLRETNVSIIKGNISLLAPALLDKLGDVKLRKPASDLLLDLCEKASPQFVLSQLYEPLKSHKNPKVTTEGLKWAQTAVIEFGISGLQIRPLVETLKQALSQSNATVRGSAVAALGTLCMFVGPDVKAALGDLSSSLASTIDAEFAKASTEQPPKPLRHYSPPGAVKTSSAVHPSSSPHTGTESFDSVAQEEVAIEDLVPRVDISAQLTPSLVQGVGDANWKVRKESMDQIIAIIEGTNRKIAANIGSDLITELKARLNDTNRNLTCLALEMISLLAISAGRSLEKSLRPIYGPILQTLSDNKPQVRAATLKALDSIAATCAAGLQGLLVEVAPALASESPCLRKDLAGWVASRLAPADGIKMPTVTGEIVDTLKEPSFLVSVAQCVSDRNADVRKAASTLLHAVADHVGGPLYIQNKLRDAKPALAQAINNVFDSYAAKPSTTLPSKVAVETTTATTKSASKPVTVAAAKAPVASLSRPMSGQKGTTAWSSASAATATTVAAAAASVASPSSASVPLQLNITSTLSNSKSTRAEKDKGHMKFVFDSVLGVAGLAGGSSATGPGSSVPGSYGGRKDLVDLLRESMEPFVSKPVLAGLFSDDFKEQLMAVSLLDEFLQPYSESLPSHDLPIHPSTISKAVLAASDLYIKYTAVRLVDSTNATLIVKCLDLFEKVCLILEHNDYQWTEYEASCIIPYLVLKLGDAKETLRARVKSLLPRVIAVYPISKLVSNYLIETLKSTKIIRLKTEIVEEIHTLAEKVPVCDLSHPPSKLVLLMATMYFGEKDGGVRHGALRVLQASVSQKSDLLDASSSQLESSGAVVTVADVLKWCSTKFTPKEISLLEEKLKKAAAVAAPVSALPAPLALPASKTESPLRALRKPTVGAFGSPMSAKSAKLAPLTAEAASSPVAIKRDKEFSLDLDKLDLPALSTKVNLPPAAATMEPSPTRSSLAAASEPLLPSFSSRLAASSRAFYSESSKIGNESIRLTLDVILSNISSEERSLANQGLTLLEARLPSSSSLMSTAHELFLSEQSGLVCSSLVGRLEYCLTVELSLLTPPNASTAGANHHLSLDRDASYQLASRLVADLLVLFLNKRMAMAVDTESLGRAFQLLISFLVLDVEHDKEKESLTALNKHANVLLIKMLEHGDKNALYSSLLSTLKTHSLKLLFQDEFSESEAKCTELVMKCLWRLTRSLQANVHSGTVHLKPLIHALHEFLSQAQPYEWKRRVTEGRLLGDLPLRTLKTILHELTAALGDSLLALVQEALGTVDWESTMIVGYLRFMLERRKKMNDDGSHSTSSALSTSGDMLGLSKSIDACATDAMMADDSAGDANKAPHVAELSETEMQERLEEIFKLVTDKNQSKQGLVTLFEFKESYPSCAPILNAFMERTGGFFRGYIARGLSTLAEEKRAALATLSTPSTAQSMATVPSAIASTTAAPIEPDSYRQKLEKMQALFQHSASATSKLTEIEKENHETFLSAEPNIFHTKTAMTTMMATTTAAAAVTATTTATSSSMSQLQPSAALADDTAKREESNFSSLKERLKKIKEPSLLE